MHKVFPSRLEHLHEMLLWITAQLPLEAKALKKMELAAEEAIVNIISHGNVNTIEIHIRLFESHVEVLFKDNGPPFDPLTVDPNLDGQVPGGLGVHLIRQCVDKVIYQRTKDGNVLSLIRLLKKP